MAFSGLRDTISESVLHIGPERTAFERKAEAAEHERRVLEGQVDALQRDMSRILTVVEGLVDQLGPKTPA